VRTIHKNFLMTLNLVPYHLGKMIKPGRIPIMLAQYMKGFLEPETSHITSGKMSVELESASTIA